MATPTPLHVTFFICNEMLATSVTLPLEQLKAAENLALAARPRLSHVPGLRVTLASVDGRAVVSNTGIRLAADCSLADIDHSDITYLPALWRNPQRQIARNRPLLDWLIAQHTKGNIVAGVGTGCCFMAEAGLLDHKAATTHWHYFDQFHRLYPKVQLKRQFFITQAQNLYCTGSVNSLADLTVQFIQRHYSAPIARHVERHFFHEIRQSYSRSMAGSHPDEDIVEAQQWLQANHASEVHLSEVAALCGMSVRSFNRRFKSATGETPLQYLHQLRIQGAKELLQNTNLSVGDVAYRTGYQDLAHFTRLFKRILGVTPSQYRTTVRAKMFTV